VLYFFLIAVFFVPLHIRLKADTEKEALKIRADIMLPLKIKIKIYSGNITVKKVIASFFSGKKKKGNKGQIFNILKKHVRLKKLDIDARIGTGEASSTAMINGGILGLIAPFRMEERCNINMEPDFNEKIFEFFGQCYLKTNLFQGLMVLFKILGGKRKWKSIPLKT